VTTAPHSVYILGLLLLQAGAAAFVEKGIADHLFLRGSLSRCCQQTKSPQRDLVVAYAAQWDWDHE
jgi:hypothetical protein